MVRLFSMKTFNVKIFVVFISVVVTYNLIFSNLFNVWTLRKLPKATTKLMRPVELEYVVVHMDLKGAPPKLAYLHSILPLLKDNGVNGLLLEYEDMFPYEGKLTNLSAKNSYKRLPLEIEVIPLVQTFGHLEFALKLGEFRHLREKLSQPDSMCPSKLESRAMVQEMLKQVINFHVSILPLKHIHVGCDEVFLMNECEQCRRKRLSDEELFIDYVRHIANVISKLSPNTTVLIWGDMLRKINAFKWQHIDVFHNVEPVYWHYAELNKFPHIDIINYRKKFKNKWFATAYKGADGRAATIPDLHKRLANHFSWMSHLQNSKIPGENQVYKFKGIILTGWSRYSHMDPLCELLPVSMASLIINLRMIRIFKSGASYDTSNSREFFSNYLFESDTNLFCDTSPGIVPNSKFVNDLCRFRGHELYYILNRYVYALNDATIFLQNNDMYVYEYYLQSRYVNKNANLTEQIEMCKTKLAIIEVIEKKVIHAMEEYYENDVIDEYVGFKSYNAKKKLVHLMKGLQTQFEFDGTWHRRPVVYAATDTNY